MPIGYAQVSTDEQSKADRLADERIANQWLWTAIGGRPRLSGAAIINRYGTFSAYLLVIAETFDPKRGELNFSNYVDYASGWLQRDLLDTADLAS